METLRISLSALLLGHNPKFAGVILLSLGELAKLAAYTVIFSIFIRALLSWFSHGLRHPITRLLGSFTDPMLKYDFIWIHEYKSFTQFSERNRRLVYEFDYWTIYSEVISPLIDCNPQQAFTARKILGSSS